MLWAFGSVMHCFCWCNL